MAASSSPQPEIIASSHHDNDDIYADEDGNESSLAPGSEAIGPSDGYFHASAESDAASRAVDGEVNQPREWRYGPAADTPRVPNILIEDPTPSIQRARDKHQQAEEERRAVEQYISPVQSPATASQQPTTMLASSPANTRLRHSDAPPAYSPARQQPSQGSSSWSEPDNPGSSNTYGTMGSDSVTSPDASRPPTSAADEEQPLLESDDDSLSRRRTSSSTRSRRSTRRWKHGMPDKYLRILGVLVMTIVICVFVLLLQLINQSRPLEDNIDTTPIRESDPAPPLLKWNPHPAKKCRKSPRDSRSISFPFPMENQKEYEFSQYADVNLMHGTFIESFGVIYIQPAPKGSELRVVLESIANDERILYSWDKQTTARRDTVITTYPVFIEGWDDADGAPCVQLQATIYIPQGTVVDKLLVSATTADIVVRNGVSLRAHKLVQFTGGQSSIGTPTLSGYEGGVEPYKLEAPKFKVEQLTGNITGWFPLYDQTNVEVGVGAIDIQIQPKLSHDKSASAAELIVGSGIGSVNVTEFWGNDTQSDAAGSAWTRVLPVREYNAEVTTLKGSVFADILVTNSAKISAKGDVDFTFRPLFLTNRQHAPLELSTTVSYGATNGRVHEPIWAYASTFKIPSSPYAKRHQTPNKQRYYTMLSRHVSFPGDCRFDYPDSWTGSGDYHSISPGSLAIQGGSGLEVIRSGSAGGLNYMEVLKGRGNSDMRLDVATGYTLLSFDGDD